MNQSLQFEQFNKLLTEHSDSAIWTQKVSSWSKWKHMSHFVFVAIGLLLYYYFTAFEELSFSKILNLDYRAILSILTAFTVVIIPFTYFYNSTSTAASIKYSIYSSFIRFEWGLYKTKKVDIPFHDIIAIDHVSYNDSDLSTIYFGTSKTYEVNKMDFSNYDSRAHITFENVKNGKEVYELLNYLKVRAQNK